MAAPASVTIPAPPDKRLETAPPSAKTQPVRDIVNYELLFDCVHCGLCLESCPTYALTRREMDSPRGRIYLMKALAEGTLELDDTAVRHLDLCLGCRGCETACPSGVHYGRLIERATDYVEKNYRRSFGERLKRRLISATFPYPRRMRWAVAPLRIAERLHLRGLVRSLMPQRLVAWMDLVPRRDEAVASDSWTQWKASADGPIAVVHHGCVAQVLADSENRNSEHALRAAGFRVIELRDTVCCGALDLHSGNRDRAIEFARRNVRAFKASGAEVILSAAAGCAATIAEYGELLKHDAGFAADAREISARVRDLSTLLVQAEVPVGHQMPCVVTYHDSCHLAHGLGVREAPRKLLKSIPGVTFVELTESDLCCGSAGSYNLTEPAMARDLVNRKVDNIAATGADYVVLGNLGCELQIAAELRRRGSKTRAIHLADFIALANR
ncbi:MAG: 4Fe-4S dicluster domain-containing protein [Candidatus Binataceae bacterium]|nr:4Fe-4S dicluster domain-containing protein [Candidatus Binataceae bacterium]